jgi:hypothetical protein
MTQSTDQNDTAFFGDFEKDVAKNIQDEIMERIVEAAWEFSEDKDVTISDLDKRDALNIEFTGSIMIEGVEHCFHIRDGNNNGTEIISWNEDSAIEHEELDPRTLIPSRNAVSDAIYHERAESFLEAWEKDKSGDGVHGTALSSLPGSAGYDAFFAPGTGAAKTHHDKAAAFGYEIGCESEALPLKKDLIRSIFKILPDLSSYPDGLKGEKPSSILLDCASLNDASTEKGAAVREKMDAMVDRMASEGSLYPTTEESEEFRSLGVIAQKRPYEVFFRKALWSRMISFEEIEGFDPKDLPENPIAEMFKALDPDLVRSTKALPSRELAVLTENLISKMSRSDTNEVDEVWYRGAERVGFRLIIDHHEPEPVSEDMEP